jgi:hypothetical protein
MAALMFRQAPIQIVSQTDIKPIRGFTPQNVDEGHEETGGRPVRVRTADLYRVNLPPIGKRTT